MDLFTNMTKKAKERGIYRNLYSTDLDSFLSSTSNKYDLIICADVLVYIGDLLSVFAGVKRVMIKHGYFSFSVEKCEQQVDFILKSSMRYGHSFQYVQGLVEQFCFKLINVQECKLRKDEEKWINGFIFLLQANK